MKTVFIVGLFIEQVICMIRPGFNWDTVGIGASALCTVHCLALPLVAGALPLLGLEFLAGPSVHHFLALGVLTFCLLAIAPGYFKHRHSLVLTGMLTGLVFVFFATFLSQTTVGDRWEIPLITVGNLLVISSHCFNRRLLKVCAAHPAGCQAGHS